VFLLLAQGCRPLQRSKVGSSDHCCMREESSCQPGALHTWPKAVYLCVAVGSYLEHTSKRLIAEQAKLYRTFDAALAEKAPPD
jgi:hypothetical protein